MKALKSGRSRRTVRTVMTFSVVMTLVTSFVRGMVSALVFAAIPALVLMLFVRGNVFLLVLSIVGLLLCVLAYTGWTMLNVVRLEFGATSGAILGVERILRTERAQQDSSEEDSR